VGIPALPNELEGALAVAFPLRGEWTAVHSPGSRIPSHGTDQLAQRYAFDLIRFDPHSKGRYYPGSSLRAVLVGVPTRDCYGWGEPVHAPLDGQVVAARDGLSERRRIHVARELALVLKTALTFRPTPEWLHRVLGNHVIIRCASAHAAFAHLTTGSVAVAAGQTVREGDVIGRVGHSGNSTAPHLHFQLMDGPDLLTAKGVPCVFRAYEVWREGAWRLAERSVPTATERIRSLGS
jgi:hypothetical protein